MLVAAAVLVAASGREKRLVGFYAVAVFASFLAATIACARLSYRDGRRVALVLNVIGAILGRDNPWHQCDPPRRLDRAAHIRRRGGLCVAHLGFTRPTPRGGCRGRPVIINSTGAHRLCGTATHIDGPGFRHVC